ncbi:hypothetical protein EON76_06815 [bacterium]|nr:MAG: hypothetical protein EON76_06815 [bacterium]
MKLGLHKAAVAFAVLAVVSGSAANAAGKQTKRGGVSTTEAKTNSTATNTQSSKLNKGGATAAAPAAGNFRRARTGFGTAAPAAPVAAKPATVKSVAPVARQERPRVSNGAKSADASAQSASAKTMAAIKTAGLDGKLSGRSAQLATVLASDVALADVASEIVKTNAAKPQLAELNQARVEGLLTIATLSSDVRDLSKDLVAPDQIKEQAYVALVQNAGREAAGWPETTQKNMVELLTKTNDKIAGGMKVAEAIEAARIEMLTISKVKIDLDQVKKLCGKV